MFCSCFARCYAPARTRVTDVTACHGGAVTQIAMNYLGFSPMSQCLISFRLQVEMKTVKAKRCYWHRKSGRGRERGRAAGCRDMRDTGRLFNNFNALPVTTRCDRVTPLP